MTNKKFKGIKIPKPFLKYVKEVPDQLWSSIYDEEYSLKAEFDVKSKGKSYLKNQYVRPPFHITRGMYNDKNIPEMVFLYLQSIGGGITQGDRRLAKVEVKKDSKVHLTTQSTTKANEMEENCGISSMEIKVEKNGYIEFLPDPTVLHKNSRLLQIVNLEIEKGGTALYSEITVPGRLGMGEIFQFEALYSTIRAQNENKRLFEDNILQVPKELGFKTPGTFDKYNILGNMYLISQTIDQNKIKKIIYNETGDREGIRVGISTLPNESGIIIRILGNTTLKIKKELKKAWNEIRKFLFGVKAPEIRK